MLAFTRGWDGRDGRDASVEANGAFDQFRHQFSGDDERVPTRLAPKPKRNQEVVVMVMVAGATKRLQNDRFSWCFVRFL